MHKSLRGLILLSLCLFHYASFSQEAMINDGGLISVIGPGGQAGNVGIAVIGNYVNNNNFGDGQIELNAGHILVTGDWKNDANNNVFVNMSGSLIDGYVTLRHNNNPQFITGTSPTFFENLILSRSDKTLNIDNCSVNGVLFLDAGFILNANTFVIKNPSPAGITYQSGFIKSETLPGAYSMVRWNIGSNQGTYAIPFGSDNLIGDNDLHFSIAIKSSMNDSDYIKFATYPSDFYNFPLPTGASPLETEERKVVDRYWIIKTNDFLTRPLVDLGFTYNSSDINPAYNAIDPQKLKASRNNYIAGQWLDMAPVGTNSGKTVTAYDIQGTDLFEAWTLVNLPGPLTDMFSPDAFTPNGDGINDKFKPVFQVDFEVFEYDLYIYNRWGNQVFHTSDQNEGWDGRKQGSDAPPFVAVYSWVIVVKGRSSYNTEAEGETKRYVGRVTIVK